MATRVGNMRCSKCGSDNREGRKFCTSCGTLFAAACPKCGAPIQPDESFCGECGTALGDAAPPADAAGTTPVAAVASGERRHLTVLFCDLVGSTEIAARLDPEEWREMVAGYQRAAAEAITRFGGHVAKYLGDGVMAFFGYPEAHDNDAERAAHAAAAGIKTKIGNHTFRATGITVYLKNKGTLEAAQHIANHESPRTTKLYDRRSDEMSLDEIEKIGI